MVPASCAVVQSRMPTPHVSVLLSQAALVGASVCLLGMVTYCAYSVMYPGLQQRRIDAAKKKRFRMYAVKVRHWVALLKQVVWYQCLSLQAQPELMSDASAGKQALRQLTDGLDSPTTATAILSPAVPGAAIFRALPRLLSRPLGPSHSHNGPPDI